VQEIPKESRRPTISDKDSFVTVTNYVTPTPDHLVCQANLVKVKRKNDLDPEKASKEPGETSTSKQQPEV
jgi:hypothetical protein